MSPDSLDSAIDDLTGELSQKSGAALRFGKSQFYQQRELDLAASYTLVTEGLAENLVRDEAREGIDAFLSKRKPIWKVLDVELIGRSVVRVVSRRRHAV